MKVYNKHIETRSRELQVSISTDVTLLNVKDGTKGTDELNAGEPSFDIRLQKAGVTGMRKVDFTSSEDELTINLHELKEGENTLRVVAKFGNFTKSVLYLHIVVADGFDNVESAEFEFNVLSAVGDGVSIVSEHVNVVLTAATEVDWTQHSVQVQNLTQETSETYELNEDGECEFDVPIGCLYVVSLPVVGDYAQPVDIQRYATIPNYTIEHEYTTETRFETLIISAHVSSLEGETVAMLEGLPVVATDTQDHMYSTTFDAQGKCRLEIPYGKTYTLSFPNVEGYSHDHTGDHHTAGVPSREIDIHYSQFLEGIYGLDAQGNQYTLDMINELADKSIIVAGAFNDADLAMSPRGDGTKGNGFCWKIGDETLGATAQWADANAEFDQTRLPFYANLGDLIYAGKHMTDMIIEIGTEMYMLTPAASQCAAKTLTIGGVDREGFLPSYDQIRKIASTNWAAFQGFYTLLGRTAPSIGSGHWWTSCQYSARYAVKLANGNVDDDSKTVSSNVFVCYDL